jgi:cobyrinic acid a,c-diamide synthase
MSIIIAGERSGVGKTTVTLMLLAALSRRSQKVQSFKVGPDYIDPMFHQEVTGHTCRNLDPVLTSEVYVQQCFELHSQDADYALIEGVMGLFDGVSGANDYASTAHIARLLDLPVILVLDCSRLSRSIAAIAHGYSTFDPRIQIAGVVLNRVGSDRHLELLTDALTPLNLPILGVLRRQDSITIPDRHLGLVPTAELNNFHALIEEFAHLGETCFDWPKLLPLLKQATRTSPLIKSPRIQNSVAKVRVAVARDAAFSFYYADNLELLERLGAELVPWSPLRDPKLPEDMQGLYFGGGFPEVFAAELANNTQAQAQVQAQIQAGLPTYAECGGLMYLCEQLIDFTGQTHRMVGILPSIAVMGKRLTLGYRKAVAMQNSPFIAQGTQVWGHEFHRSELTIKPKQPLFRMQGYAANSPQIEEGWQIYQVHASYLHIHFGAQPDIPIRFVQQCQQFVRGR